MNYNQNIKNHLLYFKLEFQKFITHLNKNFNLFKVQFLIILIEDDIILLVWADRTGEQQSLPTPASSGAARSTGPGQRNVELCSTLCLS